MLKKKEPTSITQTPEEADDSPKASSQGMTSNLSTESVDQPAASPTATVEEKKEDDKQPEEQKEESKEEESASPAFFATEANLQQMRKTLFNAEEGHRVEIKKEEDVAFITVKKFRDAQTKERKVEEESETTERKKLNKEESNSWDAIMSFWKQQNRDLEKGQKRLSSDENDARRKLDKEEQAGYQAIRKHLESEAKERKQMEDTETSERNKVEKECISEVDWLGKLRETESKERKQKENDETNARKNEDKEESNGWQEFLKHAKQVWDTEYLRRRTEKEKDWKADATVTNCVKCTTKFGLFTRKHHCRSCGGLFCDKCTSNRIEMVDLGYLNKERACDECMSKRMVSKSDQ